ncbi:hypothetical protein CR513_47897, partial [Mucuna pruriens]
MLEEFKDIFPKKIPRGLPPIRGIEHQIDFVLGYVLGFEGVKVDAKKAKAIPKLHA